MLKLRREQIEVFEQHAFEAMASRVERAIAATFPEFSVVSATADDDPRGNVPSAEVESLVERGMDRAADFGIHEGPDIAAFIALGIALRSAGSSHPLPDWISGWLNRQDTPGATKMAAIEAQLAQFGADDPVLQGVARKIAAARSLV